MSNDDHSNSDISCSGGGRSDVNTIVFAVDMTTFEFAVPIPLERFRCWDACDCWAMNALDCASVLQTWMPSYHVWPSLTWIALPQFPNQEPLRPQQLDLADLAMMPHLRHTELMVVAVAAGVYVIIDKK